MLPFSLQKIVAFFVSICLFFSLSFPFLTPAAPEFAPKYEDGEILVNFTVLADTHIESFTISRQQYLKKALLGANAAKGGSDALCIVGDMTMNGQETEYAVLYGTLAAYSKSANFFPIIGNHDTWSGESYEKELERFAGYYNNLMGGETDKVYYSKVVNGYYFLVLGTERDNGVSSYISETQLDWFAGIMEEASASGKPVFVFHHMPLNNTNNVQNQWPEGAMGEQSDAVQAIMEAYDNVFFFTGHLHNTYDHSAFSKIGDSLYLVDGPVFGQGGYGSILDPGKGWQVEGYADKVVLRARNFIQNEWYETYEYEIPLN
ncbi:MAG: metallophosphoesterase [Oscillospiraceae bacterium]|nr:metallophosphoesterase [Oscillospiraceae bacterium]